MIKRAHELQETFHPLQTFIAEFTWSSPSLQSKKIGSFLVPNLWPLAWPCSVPWLTLVVPGSGQQEGSKCQKLMKKTFHFLIKIRIQSTGNFTAEPLLVKVSMPWELPMIQLSSNYLTVNLGSIPALNSAEFTSHHPLASAMLLALALLTCVHFWGHKLWHSSWSVSQESLFWFVTPFRSVTKYYNLQTPERMRQAFICLSRDQIQPIPPKYLWTGQER